MLAIEYNRENHQIYGILAELHNQGEQITLCPVPAHMGINRNKEAAKQAAYMPGMTSTIHQVDYKLRVATRMEKRN